MGADLLNIGGVSPYLLIAFGGFVLFVFTNGIVLANAVKQRTRHRKIALGALETQVVWTLVPAIILALFITSTLPKHTQQPIAKSTTPQYQAPATKVFFE